MTGYSDEGQDTLQRHAQTLQILEPDGACASRRHDAFDSLDAQSRHTQQRFARGAIDVDRKQLAMPQSPCELGIDLQIEHAVGPDEQLLGIEPVEAQQPIALIETMLAQQRSSLERQQS